MVLLALESENGAVLTYRLSKSQITVGSSSGRIMSKSGCTTVLVDGPKTPNFLRQPRTSVTVNLLQFRSSIAATGTTRARQNPDACEARDQDHRPMYRESMSVDPSQ